jgi:hypothetical protein
MKLILEASFVLPDVTRRGVLHTVTKKHYKVQTISCTRSHIVKHDLTEPMIPRLIRLYSKRPMRVKILILLSALLPQAHRGAYDSTTCRERVKDSHALGII